MVLTWLASQGLQVLSVPTVTSNTPEVGRTSQVVLTLNSLPRSVDTMTIVSSLSSPLVQTEPNVDIPPVRVSPAGPVLPRPALLPLQLQTVRAPPTWPPARVCPGPGVAHVLETAVLLALGGREGGAVSIVNTGREESCVPANSPPALHPDGHVTVYSEQAPEDHHQEEQSHD